MLELRGLEKRYATGDHALRGVSLIVPESQVLGLIGPSGAGKSTLIRCINRLVEPTGGEVWIAGQEMCRLRGAALRRARRDIGMIFQDHALIERLTVMENLLAGRLGYVGFWAAWFRRFPREDFQRAFDLLERVGLSEQVNKRADALSGGQRQRVGIARALMQAPRLLLVDEPTASLDPKTARDVLRLITGLAREARVTTIINSHDVNLTRQFCDRIVGLRKGQVVFDGAPAELVTSRLAEIYGGEDWHEVDSSPVHAAHVAPMAAEAAL